MYHRGELTCIRVLMLWKGCCVKRWLWIVRTTFLCMIDDLHTSVLDTKIQIGDKGVLLMYDVGSRV